MLSLEILGFLAERPHHGYDLRRRINELSGATRVISDGALYPALKRLENAGHIASHTEPGDRGRPRKVFSITDSGREALYEMLRHPSDAAMEYEPRFMVILAFLSALPDADERTAVLARRREILRRPISFFYSSDGTPVRSSDVDDPYKRGMFLTASAGRKAQIAWLDEMLGV